MYIRIRKREKCLLRTTEDEFMRIHTHCTGPVHVEQTYRFFPIKANLASDDLSVCDDELFGWDNSFRSSKIRVLVSVSKFGNDDSINFSSCKTVACSADEFVSLSSISGQSK